MAITTDLIEQIHYYILSIPNIQDVDRRMQIARYADLPENLIHQIDWGKQPTDLFASNFIEKAENWGEYSVSDSRIALIEFLRATERLIGGRQQVNLLELVERIRMELVLKEKSLRVPTVYNPTPDEKVLEKLIGEPTLLPMSFLEKCLFMARSVACVDVGFQMGTGFLISTNLFITNHHVIPDVKSANYSVFRFNYQQDISGTIGPLDDYRAKKGGLFYTDPIFDITILELDGNPGKIWGTISLLVTTQVKKDDRVNIIQHPGGKPKQISFRNNFVEYVDDKVIQYLTHTEPGSSGSPVINDQLELIAIHHAGDEKLREPKTQRRYFRNEGILINAVVNALPKDIRNKISESVTS